MALEKCPYCGGDVSSEAKQCPHCNKELHEKDKKPVNKRMVYGGAAAVAAIAIIVGGIYVSNVQKEKRIETLVTETEASIAEHDSETAMSNINELLDLGYDTVDLKNSLQDALLAAAEDAYQQLDFGTVNSYYDELDELGYDTTGLREVEQYDLDTFDDARKVYDTIQDIHTKLSAGNFNPLSELLKLLDSTIDFADSLEINQDSKIGQYLHDLTTDYWYTAYKNGLYHDYEGVDYGFTSSGHAYIRDTFCEGMAKVAFPYDVDSIRMTADTKQESDEDSEETNPLTSFDVDFPVTESDTQDLVDESAEDIIAVVETKADDAEETNASDIAEDTEIIDVTNTDEQSTASNDVTGTVILDGEVDLSNINSEGIAIDSSGLPSYIEVKAAKTEKGKLCIFFTNTGDDNVPDKNIKVIYHDTSGAAIYVSEGSFYTLSAHHTMPKIFAMPKDFASISFECNDSIFKWNDHTDEVDLAANLNIDDKVLVITGSNRSDVEINFLSYSVVFWKGNSIVDVASDEFINIQPGESMVDQIKWASIPMDRYEVYLRSAVE